MQPKPEYFGAKYAETFKAQSVVDAYQYRPPYPAEVFDILERLITVSPRMALDVGSGSGDIARPLASRVERVDAVDFSLNMIERGKLLPDGDHPHLHWIYGRIEEVSLTAPYALITAGSSIHWMDWERVFPRFHAVLASGGLLALLHRHTLPMPWDIEIRALRQYYKRQRPESSDTVEELVQRGLFAVQGRQETAPVPFTQSIDDFIEGLHSRSSFSNVLMQPEERAEFDQRVRSILIAACPDGMLPLQVTATVTWGLPAKK